MTTEKNYKTRGNYPVPFCIRQTKCNNFPKKCEECFKYREWKEKK